ncbi:hypothetical protein BRD17_01775 [Halobacteriales archaeon SW_7_68_16]|nr:MAG: hypothetical protein BRD17_01775 [Halobacteriales archaeon SW_7_68_16]
MGIGDMVGRWQRNAWLLIVAGLAVAVLSGAPVAADGSGDVVASCTASPTTVEPGETVTLDASDSDAVFVEFDVDGDGEYDRGDETDFVIETTYAEPGTYEPVARSDDGDTDPCGTVVVTESPSAALSISPRPATAGEPTTFDASSSSDPDGRIVTYRWDFDRDPAVDMTTEVASVDHTYDEPGSVTPTLTVEDDDGATDTISRDLSVERPSSASCTASPTTVEPGETVTLDASDSNATFVEFDVDGDGEYDRGDETDFVIETTYAEPGTYEPVARADNDPNATDPCGTVTVETNEPPTAEFSISPRPGTADEAVGFDASASSDPDGEIVEYRWDGDGDGTVDRTVSTPETDFVYDDAGSYVPTLTVVDDDNATAATSRDLRIEPATSVVCRADPTTIAVGESVTLDAVARGDGDPEATDPCGEVTVEAANDPPEAALTVSPPSPTAGATITFDGSGSTDPDGRVVEYRWDFEADGTVDRTTSGATATTTRSPAGAYLGAVTVVDDDGATATARREYGVVARPEPTARCAIEVRTVRPGETVFVSASASTNASQYALDTDGDGEYEITDRTDSTFEVSYEEPGTYTPVVRARGNESSDTVECPTVTVQEPSPEPTTEEDEDDDGIPLLPILGAGGLAGLGGLVYYFYPRGGGGGRGPDRSPNPDLKSQATRGRYETGVFALPTTSGTISVPVGFQPDVITVAATNGARTDPTVDRTTGWSRGIVHRTADGLVHQSLTVADDARSRDQSTAAISDDAAIELVRHEDDGPPSRVPVAVSETTTTGFEAEVTVPGDDPLAGDTRVLFTAISLEPGIDAEVGFFETPTEPGTATVDLGVDADHVALSAATAVDATDALWTTDRGVAVSRGHAVVDDEGRPSQVTGGVSAWPRAGDAAAATADDRRAIGLLYQDGVDVAGRTTARVTDLGETLRLRYDRVYSGPHKLGSTACHPISYLALSTDRMCPAVGSCRLPAVGAETTVDVGFRPTLIELTVVPAAPGETSTDRTAYPFGWSRGTAIARDGAIRQYVLHHAVATDPVPTGIDAPGDATDATAGTTGQVASDGGLHDDRPDAGSRLDAPTFDGVDIHPAGIPGPGEPAVAAEPTAHDDGRAGLWLRRNADGAIVGREELRVTATGAAGFTLATRTVDTEAAAPDDERSTVLYRAWPALDDLDGESTAAPESWRGDVADAAGSDDTSTTNDASE